MTTFAQPFDDYEILDRVGGGAMGTVFKARHKSLNRIVALKVLKPSLARDKRYVERLRREARIVASLSHPHIVTGYDLGEEGGYHFFVMEFVEGKSLRQLLVEWGMFAEEYVLRVAREVALALDHAYQRGVIHRDIKPGNILIDETGCVKLTDMGLAKGPADLTLTRDGATVGTPMYISPEQARNPQDVDVRSDLYSLGATLYHMATGMPPFRGDTMAELITNVLNENVVPPDEANSAVSPGVSLVIRKLLAKNLTVRYQTPRELLDDLDRIEKAQPPAVDAGRLDLDESEPGAWVRGVLLGLAGLLLAALAWWIGQEMRDPVDREPTAEQFLAELDADLERLSTPGAQFVRLSTITNWPVGSALELEQRRKVVAAELQRRVDAVADELLTPEWPRMLAWLTDPTRWPDRAQFERHHLQPRLQEAAGISLGQLPARVRLHRIDALLQAVDRAIAARDAEFKSRFEQFLATTLPARADEQLRAGNFAAADRLWRDALPTFCDGVRQPFPERLPDDLQHAMRDQQQLAEQVARSRIGRAERAVADALTAEVSAVVALLVERLTAGVDPAVVDQALQRLRVDLGQHWPPASNFRPVGNPWPDLEQQLAVAQQVVNLAASEALAELFEQRCDLGWRVFNNGTAVAAAAVFEDIEPATAAQEEELQGHRRALAAAAAVERALLEAIAQQNRPPVAFPLRGGSDPVELRVLSGNDGLRLEGQPVAQPARTMRLTELRLSDLIERLSAGAGGPLRQLPDPTGPLGLAVLRLVADDGAGLERDLAHLPSPQRQFLLDRVWPRLLRVRDARAPTPLDRADLFARLERELAAIDEGGSLTELEKAVLACSQVPDAECTGKQLRLRRQARARLDLARRERDVADELARSAPRGAGVDVSVVDRELVAAVTLPAAVLQGEAGDGWRLRGDLIEFAGGGRPWGEQPLPLLRASPGFDARSSRTQVTCELVLPGAAVGRRFYLLEFRGISVALVIAANDSVQVALVEGDALRADRVQRAFERALSGAFAPPRATALPGGRHLLTIDVKVTDARTQAMVKVSFEQTELLRELHGLDAQHPPTFSLYPLQEIAVARVVVRAAGL